MKRFAIALSAFVLLGSLAPLAVAKSCKNIEVLVLGSGGPELDDGRNSSGFAILVDGEATLLVDAGAGTAREFERSGQSFNTVEGILLTHLHVDHVNDLAAYIKGAFFTGRKQDLHVFGPTGNEHLPDTKQYVERILDKKTGLYPYLHRQLPEHAGMYDYKILASAVSAAKVTVNALPGGIDVTSVPTSHGPLPSVAWRIDIDGCKLAFMGDTNAKVLKPFNRYLEAPDLLVLNMPLGLDAPEPAQNLHMGPEDLAKLIKQAKPKLTMLAHLMKRSLKNLDTNVAYIRSAARSPVVVAEDGLVLGVALANDGSNGIKE